jgi:hypothetical protein
MEMPDFKSGSQLVHGGAIIPFVLHVLVTEPFHDRGEDCHS